MHSSHRHCTLAAAAAVATSLGVAPAHAQSTAQPAARAQSVTVRASTAYDRGDTWRWLFGDAWRDTWSAEITVPVLDLDRFAGGLTPSKAGGNQSKTLRFQGANGREYIFRSTAKNFRKALPGDAKAMPVGGLAQDQTASLHPTGHLVVAVLQEAVGVLHTPPALVCLPDDARLGEFRDEFAHMLGQIEERPDDNDHGATFANAKKIINTERLAERLEEDTDHRLDTRDYLKARLIDFLVGDTDRGADQWRFAKFERGGHDVYRPIPRDRDYAFMKVEGPLPAIARRVHPRLVRYGEEYPGLGSLLYMTMEFDRSHLVGLAWEEWESTAAFVKARLTDQVIEEAVARLPDAHHQLSGAELTAGLKARREALTGIAREFYLLVNRDADIFASDEAERVEIHRHPDGHVDVRIWRSRGKDKPDAVPASTGRIAHDEPVFERHFVPEETREVRVYLERGNDVAVVRGLSEGGITVRVIGGEGDDVLADSSLAERITAIHFYDASGENTFVAGPRTRVVSRPFVIDPPVRYEEDDDKKDDRALSEERRGRYRDRIRSGDDFTDARAGMWPRFWGEDDGWKAMTGYRESGGVVAGFGPTLTHYGFRREPYAWRAGVRGMVGLGNGELGVALAADRHLENSPWSLALVAHATQLESNRFYGYGNTTEWLDADISLVERFEVLVQPSLRYAFGEHSGLAFGPIVKYVDPEILRGSPADLAAPTGTGPFGQAGAFAELDVDGTEVRAEKQSGAGLTTGVSAYPSAWDAEEAFGEAHALARLFIPMRWPTLALRAGGQRNWGRFPLHESAFIGGRWSLRGFRWNRFAGDASAFGSVELRVPVARVTLVTRGQLGVIGFADAGRVWMDGDSSGDWHSGVGGGLWFGSLGRQVSFTYARGEQSRVYFYIGMPF